MTFATLEELEKTDLVVHLREELASANKTIEHLTRAYKTLRERSNAEIMKYRAEIARMKRITKAVSLEK